MGQHTTSSIYDYAVLYKLYELSSETYVIEQRKRQFELRALKSNTADVDLEQLRLALYIKQPYIQVSII